MRTIRTLVVALLAAVLGLGVTTIAPAHADSSLPKRVITEEPPGDHQVTYNAFKLKGKVENPVVDAAGTVTYTPYADSKIQLQKKACKKCNWRTVKKFRTDESGIYKTRIYAPKSGRWKWRVKVKGSDGYATTKGTAWTLYFR
ncbi:hypothetical protein DDE18_13915 [Nocardioides gansuensis]|uniref:Uncharacterized protein n=1 Tax=Nocardioides gansuensis TaxID=2138300 RepID=A0A2T8FA14_9ACTN|nr:hypothetical protein [Nocardioides gansuensis]PVG82535.1 hypothetical protein DDE18_13915 [Nocardioides gansuensis]